MTNRLILAVALSVVVLIVSQIFLGRVYRKAVPQGGTRPTGYPSKMGDVGAPKGGSSQERADKAGQESIPLQQIESKEVKTSPGKPEKEMVKIDSELQELLFSSEGEILHWYLRTYKEKDGSLVDLASGSRPTSDYKYEVFPLKNENGVLLSTKAEGVEVIKEFIIEKEKKYQALIKFQIKNNSNVKKDISIFKWGSGIGGTTNPRELTITSWINGSVVRRGAHKIKETIAQGKEVKWTGLAEKHFAIALIPKGEEQRIFILKEGQELFIQSIVEKVPPGARLEGELLIYAGPKESGVLKSSGYNLEALINYGSIGKVIFYLLKLFYQITKNYGFAIILLALLIKIALFPLTRVGLKSMKEMQKLQPQINMLKQRFKHDPGALQRETMELYKRMKINPLGGCLPLIFQLPIFWALFVVLRDAIELRQSPFIFWIRDLSTKDPYYILPILMGVTTFIQQKMTSTDTQQSPMTYFMTIFLTVIFLNFPAGLVLYWFITNIFSIGEQKLITRMS